MLFRRPIPNAGKYDQRISIYQATASSLNSFNEDVPGVPALVGTFWANIEFLQGLELEAARQRWAEARYSITMRRQPDVAILRKNTISWNGLTLDILDVRGPGTRDAEWIITAKDMYVS